MEFFKPIVWIDQKFQACVDWIAHSILLIFGVKLSLQRYTVMTLVIVTLVGDYFYPPPEERHVIFLILYLILAAFLLKVQHMARRMDELREQHGIRIDPKNFPFLNVAKGYFFFVLIQSFWGQHIDPIDVVNRAAWLVHVYLFFTPPTPPPIERHEEVPSLST